MTKKKAFSLIELSIVILIIGVLVAGVTQSSRLIRQFRLSVAQSLTDSSPVNTIPDLMAWYETTKETSTFNGANYQLDDGSAVTILKDIKQTSSVKYDLAANAGSNPIYKEEGINKLPSLLFNKSDANQKLSNTTVSSYGDSYTIFVVTNFSSSPSIAYQLVALYDAGSSIEYAVSVNSSNNFIGYSYNDPSNNGYVVSDSAQNLNRSYVISYVYNTSKNDARFYMNGTRQDASTDTTAPTVQFPVTRIFVGGHLSASRTPDGLIGELIIFNRGLKDEERTSIEEYLKKKWGI